MVSETSDGRWLTTIKLSPYLRPSLAILSIECLIVGDAAPLPAVIKMDMPNPIPNSSNVNVYDEWNKNWIDIAFETVIKRWWKE